MMRMAHDILRDMKTAAPALLPLFRSQAQAELLGVLFTPGARELSIRELAGMTGIPEPTISREVARLERHEVLVSHNVGRTKLVAANWRAPWADALSRLVAYVAGVRVAIGRALQEVDGVANCSHITSHNTPNVCTSLSV